MSIFVASTKSISRGKGQSAVASASYRAGVKLEDERYGKTHDYTKRFGVMHSEIVMPKSLRDKNITIDRQELWNKAEKAENRKDARVAREWLVNLPYKLTEKERQSLAKEFSEILADKYSVVVDFAIHQPTQKEIDRGADPRNFHAHIMLTTRKAELNDNNEVVLTEKSTAELSDKKRLSLGMERMSQEIKDVRKIWEVVANERLAKHDLDLIDSRSYKERGLDIIPQVKMGVDATHLERRTGEKSHKGIINDIIKERNELVFNSRKRTEQREQTNDRLRTAIAKATKISDWATKNADWSEKVTAWANNRTGAVNKRIDYTKQEIVESERAITARTSRQQPSPYDEQYRASVNRRKQATAELAEQERRTTDDSNRAYNYTIEHGADDKARAEHVEEVKLKFAFELLTADKNVNKYDQRQIDVIADFVTSLNITNNNDFREKLSSVKNMIDDKFLDDNVHLIQLVKDPVSEREQYNANLDRSESLDVNSNDTPTNTQKEQSATNESDYRPNRPTF